MKLHFNPYREVIIASVIFGTAGVFIKHIALPATSLAFFRMAIPALVIGLWMWHTQKDFFRHGDRKMLLSISSLNVIRMYLYFVGFTMTSAGNAVVALYTSPIFAMVFAVWLLKEKMNRVRYMSIVLAFGGLVVIGYDRGLSFNNSDIVGIVAMVLSACLGGYVTVLMKTSLRTYDKVSLIFYQCFMGAIVFFPFMLLNGPLPDLGQIEIATLYALLIGIVGFVFYFSALKRADMTIVSILTYMEMVSGIVFAGLILGEYITFPLITGAVLIIISGLLLIRENKICNKINQLYT